MQPKQQQNRAELMVIEEKIHTQIWIHAEAIRLMARDGRVMQAYGMFCRPVGPL